MASQSFVYKFLVPEEAVAEMAAANFDLTTVDGVREYLKETEFGVCGQIAELSGGTANYTFRAEISKPYAGKSTIIVKHARPYIKGMTLGFDVSRQNFEVEALRRVKGVIPDSALVTVPEVYLFDEKECVIIMEDCGEKSMHLKQFMREGRLPSPMAGEVGEGLGEFIGRIHVWGRDKPAWEFFDGNIQARELSAWVTYGRLLETLDKSQNAKLSVLQDPPLEVGPDDLAAVKKVAEEMGTAIRNRQETFVMGDFWPGNIIIKLNEEGDLERIYVVDWELSKPGLAGVELGQFCAEIGFVRHFHPEYTAVANAVLRSFFKAYEEMAKPDKTTFKTTAIHAGTHWVTWGSRLPWGGKEETREVVKKGVRLVLEGDISEFRLE